MDINQRILTSARQLIAERGYRAGLWMNYLQLISANAPCIATTPVRKNSLLLLMVSWRI